MMWSNAELKERAKLALKRNYWNTVITTFVFALLMGTGVVNVDFSFEVYESSYVSFNFLGFTIFNLSGILFTILFIVSILCTFLFVNVIEVGGSKYFIENAQHESSLETLFFGFEENYKNIVFIQFKKNIKIFLWTLAFIIPGIIKTYEYFMIPYILADNPHISEKEAFNKSKEMMDGHKMDLFILELSFFGWALLSVVTLGIAGIFYVDPYIQGTLAELYLELKKITNPTLEENTIINDNNVYEY